MLQWYVLLLLAGPKRKVDGSWVEIGFHWLWVKDRVIRRLWCEWVPLSHKKSRAESGEPKNHKLWSLFDRHWWKRLLRNSWRNMSTHVSWLQAPETCFIQMPLVWSWPNPRDQGCWTGRNSTVIRLWRRRCLHCGSTGHTSVLSLIPMQNWRTSLGLECCVQGIATQ